MLTLQNVDKYFYRHKSNQIHVINDTSLEFGETGLTALLGPSGCGKTTLLNVIGGLDKPDRGKIYINGQRITGRTSRSVDKIRNLNIGYIFQNYNLINNMTVFDNVAMVLKMVGIKDKQEIKEKVEYALELVGMYRYRKRYADMLSGGERQRVGIARAIVKNPSIIIADEPTGNLDSANTLEVMNIIKAISREKLVILVTHEESLANFYADRIIRLKDGEVISDEIKPGAAQAVSELKKAGVTRTVMLTGDAEGIASNVASALGIDEYHAQLLPEDKVRQVETLLKRKEGDGKGTLAFVGDGINDAPVLSRADIGIAMGALGSDAAIEAADVVLMDDDPAKIARAIRIARKCIRIVNENIWFALGVKAVCLILGALGIANMWLAIFADVGVMVLCVLNAIRALIAQ